MPFLSKITTFTFNKESFWASGGFMFVKNLLLFINFLSLLAGIIMIGGGGYLQSTNGTDDITNMGASVAVAAIIIGIIITIVSFLGCFGAANEKGVLLKTYFVMLLVLVILEISVGSAAYAKRGDIPTYVENGWRQAYRHQPSNILVVEQTFRCCGFMNTTDMSIPVNCVEQYPDRNTPCFAIVDESLRGSLNMIGGAGLVIGFTELVGLIFSVVLFRRIAKRDSQGEGLLNEAWRVNRSKIHYGYQNYQYV
ncbi:Tetraspanin family-domain-containing protein [Cladochytrium replicatum]|nr:Tetraspanin family-domain-containing protein [Cladochytrium replicatum]